MVKIIKKGIVTFAGFTCQPRDALMGRSQENQWLGELHGGAKALGNPLFLADVTMPFYCFPGKTGGDQIALVAHLKACTTQEAAAFLDGTSTVPGTVHNRTISKKEATAPPSPQERGFGPLTYLEPRHEALQALGVSQQTAELFDTS